MEFWGLVVKPGESPTVKVEEDYVLNISMAALGKENKPKAHSTIYVEVDGTQFSIGTLSARQPTQISYNLVFEKDFILSHTSKSATVYFTGYKLFQKDTLAPIEPEKEDDEEPKKKDDNKAEKDDETEEEEDETEKNFDDEGEKIRGRKRSSPAKGNKPPKKSKKGGN